VEREKGTLHYRFSPILGRKFIQTGNSRSGVSNANTFSEALIERRVEDHGELAIVFAYSPDHLSLIRRRGKLANGARQTRPSRARALASWTTTLN
jgi:hypothetical protein